MTIRGLLSRHARLYARGRAALLGGRVILLGATLVAVVLFCKRAGLDLPLRMPALPTGGGWSDRVLGWVVVSIVGLVQGAFLLAAVFVLALLARVLGGFVLRPAPARVAAHLDRTLRTDRFASALEARGRFGPLVEKAALERPPPADALARRRGGRLERWLRRFAILLVLLVAAAPGTAPGEEGMAPVDAPPDRGQQDAPLRLTLGGEKRRFGAGEPIPVQVMAEAAAAPAADIDLEVRFAVDGGDEIATGKRVFLPAGVPDQHALAFDLRRFTDGLEAGEHEAVARAGDLESNVYRFRIEPPGGDGGAPPPDPPPPQGEAPAPQPAPGGGREEWQPEFVEPLVANEDKVKKNARVPLEVPGAGAPQERTLEEAWPELEKRKEAALNRPELSPAARTLVREYFERLRPATEETK